MHPPAPAATPAPVVVPVAAEAAPAEASKPPPTASSPAAAAGPPPAPADPPEAPAADAKPEASTSEPPKHEAPKLMTTPVTPKRRSDDGEEAEVDRVLLAQEFSGLLQDPGADDERSS